MKRNNTICFNIRLAWHEIARMYQSHANEHGVSVSLAYVLLSLKKDQLIKSTQIAPMLGMEASSLTRIIKTLEQNKWIKKYPGKEDKREVYIGLTEEGVERRRLASKVVKKFNAQVRENISQEEITQFMKTLKKINELSKDNHYAKD